MRSKQNWQSAGRIGLLGLVFLILTRLISEIAFLLAQPTYQSLRTFHPTDDKNLNSYLSIE